MVLLLAGCTTQPTTDLYGKGTHTGTVTALRVDAPARCRETAAEQEPPRFVRLRHKMDLAGLECSRSVVTDNDLITLTLTNAFVKYFKEPDALGLAAGPGHQQNRKGEIALVMSFEAGSEHGESILVYASQGQTLGSFLNVEDWPIVGPIKIDGDSIKVRLVMIELDQAENAQAQAFIRRLVGLAATLSPGSAAALRITQPIAETLIELNRDDVVLDQRLSLHRVTPGISPTRTPLLYGKYVFVLQEDRLRDMDVNRTALEATSPVALSQLRYDRYSEQLYKIYNYYPYPAPDDEDDGEVPDYSEDRASLQGGLFNEGPGPIDYSGFFSTGGNGCPPFAMRDGLLKKWINGPKAIKERQDRLGYERGELGDLGLYSCLDSALTAVYREARRGQADIPGGKIQAASPDGRYIFNYPVTQYPRAYTVLAQYPLHTHLVFSVDRSLGGVGDPAHKRLQAYADFVQAEVARAQGDATANRLFDELKTAFDTNRREHVLLREVTAEPDKTKKVCLLYRALPASAGTGAISDAVIFNEIFHLTNKVFSSREGIRTYLTQQPACTADSKGEPSCCGPVRTPSSLPQPDEELRTIQKFLIKEQGAGAVGSTGADGLWGDSTKKAVVKYLTANFEDLKTTSLKDRFANMAQPPDFAKESKANLKAFMLALIES